MTGDLPSSIVAEISFIGRGSGAVKNLSGYKKGRHSMPDVANATTNAFLGKICATELADEAEALFQQVRTAMSYKRKDLSLSVTSPTAVLSARDFSVEWLYELQEQDPSHYATTLTLRGLRDVDVARQEGFDAVFAGRFSEISFALRKGARVEAVIDAIEALDDEAELSVTYPSDCAYWEIAATGVDAAVRCSGASLEMVFPRGGSPRELIDGFGALRGAFGISKALAGLIG